MKQTLAEGSSSSTQVYTVALAGNPNTGKSTLFNGLTGLKQHTGNWPGKTVGKAEGKAQFGSISFHLVDLPGTYSLLSTSTDEEIARDFLLFGQPDVTCIVADATRLERNLNLVMQILQINSRVVLALNLMDEAKRNGISVDHRALGRELGIPVQPITARSGEGVKDLLACMADLASGSLKPTPRILPAFSPAIEQAIDSLCKDLLELYPGLRQPRWVALRLLDGDQSIVAAMEQGTFVDSLGKRT